MAGADDKVIAMPPRQTRESVGPTHSIPIIDDADVDSVRSQELHGRLNYARKYGEPVEQSKTYIEFIKEHETEKLPCKQKRVRTRKAIYDEVPCTLYRSHSLEMLRVMSLCLST